MRGRFIISTGVLLLAVYLFGYLGFWQFGVCRVWVSEDEILVVQQKMGGKTNTAGEVLVPEGTLGVWERVFTTGRYFFNPLYYQVEKFPMVEIPATKVGIVTSKVGKTLPPGEFLADQTQKGIWRRVLTPGRYAINPKGFSVTLVDMTQIPTGYVGCVTTLSGNQPKHGRLADPTEQGIQRNVLNPGLYPLNPRAVKVDIIEVGYNLLNLEGVEFPSADGFNIFLDTSVVWGLLPENVPYIINQFGDFDAVVNKIINPQVTSICMLEGSKLGAKEFIEGESREAFQKGFTDQLKTVCTSKRANVLICLIRDITIPRDIKDPIQQTFINVELKLTKDEQRQTAKTKSELQQLISEVEKGKAEVVSETSRMEQNVQALGRRDVSQISADAEVKIAEINKEIAKIEAESDFIFGEAKARADKMIGQATSDRFTQFVKVFGAANSYISWIFASRLPDDMSIQLRYSGDGTFWTDTGSTGNTPLASDKATLKMLHRQLKESQR